MSVAAAALGRGITEVLHYTSEKGVMGSIIVDALLPRAQVETNEEVAFIYEGVWDRSRDMDWIGHTSMSVTKVNTDLFRRSRWNHPQWWWAIMSFPVDILDDPDVVFTTTNNAYTETCQRSSGLDGFTAMFAEAVPWGYFDTVARRGPGFPLALPTHNAAEILYPDALPLSQLSALYLPDPTNLSLIRTWCEIYGRDPLNIVVRPNLF
jgi:hypothetical protein